MADSLVGNQSDMQMPETWMDKFQKFFPQNPLAPLDPFSAVARHYSNKLDESTAHQTINGQEPMQAMIPTKVNNLFRQLQRENKMGPMQEWLLKTLAIEQGAK
jgi:hypothetical protein